MAQFSQTVHIDALPASVFAFVADRIRAGPLDPRLKVLRVDSEDGRPRTVHLLVTAPGMKPMELAADVAAYEPDRLIVLRSSPSSRGPQFSLRYACVPSGAGTNLTCDIEIRIGGLTGGLLDHFLKRSLEDYAGQALGIAKQELEAG